MESNFFSVVLRRGVLPGVEEKMGRIILERAMALNSLD